MKITCVGHAGLLIETESTSILCDPWFNEAYLNSWIPFPSNEHVEQDKLLHCDFLFISSSGQDRCDVEFLGRVDKAVAVILPDFKSFNLQNILIDLGFYNFIHIPNNIVFKLTNSLEIIVSTNSSNMYGAMPTATIAIGDGINSIFVQTNQLDKKSKDLTTFKQYDIHFAQIAAPSWYPMVTENPESIKDILSKQLRNEQMQGFLEVIKTFNAKVVVPYGGPPCFLDKDLFYLNDVDSFETGSKLFVDAYSAIQYLQNNGIENTLLAYPETEIVIEGNFIKLTTPNLQSKGLDIAYVDKKRYLTSLANKRCKESMPDKERPTTDLLKQSYLLEKLCEFIEPIVPELNLIRVGLNGRILISTHTESVVIDLLDLKIEKFSGQLCRFKFYIEDDVLKRAIESSNNEAFKSLFYSCRFATELDGFNNDLVYAFLMALSPEAIENLEAVLEKNPKISDEAEINGYRIQRYCPHLKADLSQYGQIDQNIITCTVHGWQFDLESGKCITQDDRKLFVKKLNNKK